ncbi:MAG TPA: AMP nucleosidase [Alphaproteobacteria bacterium]|nr:AMP nucleosidase [Alphaproteobacteria bacterium]HAJ47340.1 AMP nucleosidase [Alphaproteobacteria bacterium]
MPHAQKASAAIDDLERLYANAVTALREALSRFANDRTAPTPQERAQFRYPELRVHYDPAGTVPVLSRAYAKLSEPGTFATTLTHPRYFRPYLLEQLTALSRDYGITIEVLPSATEIAYPYCLENTDELAFGGASPAELARAFPYPMLSSVGDEIADGDWIFGPDSAKPLALFDAPRTDYSLRRLVHYTGTPWRHIQPWILFTNYHRYVDAFIDWALAQIADGSEFEALSASGYVVADRNTPNPRELIQNAPWRRFQMPAYHLMRRNGEGLSLINIGVGPSNAKNVTDHLAVLRPHCWLMIGHCGGLRQSQRIGDYVLAHAYLRDDNILDEVMPPEIPLPAIAEVQVALHTAASIITGASGEELKHRLRTGTVVTTDDRNWELRFTAQRRRFNQSRAIAIDMESGTIAAQGFRFRVPYGTLLCVSDKPLHGEIKLPGAADRFYETAVGQHLQIGIETLELLRREQSRLHSRKLRAFDEPPFR